MMKLITWACDPYPHATSLPEQQMRGLWASTGIVAIPGGDRLPVGATMGEQVKRGSDSEDTSESGRAPSDYEESSDEDCLSIPSDVDALRDDSDSDYGRGFDWESDAESDDDADAMAADSDGDADAIAQGLAADVEPMMESTSVQMLLD